MATDVLLMRDVEGLGTEGEVVSVADGYARNYLIPQRLAAPVTEATRRRLAKMQADREQKRQAEQEAARALAARLDGTSCTIAVKTVEGEKLYGSVTGVEIAAALQEQGLEIDRHAIVIEHPLKEMGVYDVAVQLHPEVTATIKVWVVEE